MEMPRKLTVSMLSVTVMQLRDMVESVTEEKEPALARCAGTLPRRLERFLARFFSICNGGREKIVTWDSRNLSLLCN